METLKLLEQSTSFGAGTLILTTEEIGGNPTGMPGVVYASKAERATFFCSVILINGHDIGVFSEMEAGGSLDVIGHHELSYEYQNPATLMKDYKEGVFSEALIQAQRISLSLLE